MAIKISGAGSSGNNDERTVERSGRSGRVIQPLWNIVANAAIRTGPHTRDPRAGDERQPEKRGAGGKPVARAFVHSRVEWNVDTTAAVKVWAGRAFP